MEKTCHCLRFKVGGLQHQNRQLQHDKQALRAKVEELKSSGAQSLTEAQSKIDVAVVALETLLAKLRV